MGVVSTKERREGEGMSRLGDEGRIGMVVKLAAPRRCSFRFERQMHWPFHADRERRREVTRHLD